MSKLQTTAGQQNRDPAAPATPGHAFWTWFAGNEARLRRAYDERNTAPDQLQGLFVELRQQLDRIEDGLAFEFGRAEDDIYEFVLSADGIIERFPTVVGLKKAAPAIEGWRVIAFRPRVDDLMDVRYQNHDLKAQMIWYEVEEVDGLPDIVLYIKGFGYGDDRAMVGASFIMLDMALGEFDLATRIGAIDFEPLPEDPEKHGLKPIEDLRAEFDALFPQTRH